MAFDVNDKDQIFIDPVSGQGNCRFRGKLVVSKGFKDLFSSKFHMDRAILHIVSAILDKYPEGAAPIQLLTFNNVPMVLQEVNNKDYISLSSETFFLRDELNKIEYEKQ